MTQTTEMSLVQAALQTPYYAGVFLTLAEICYVDGGTAPNIPQGIYNAVTGLPQLPALGQTGQSAPSQVVSGSWSLDWGPAVTPDNSNVIYIASYRDSTGAPYFFSVNIRGTNIAAGPVALYQQIIQDMSDFRLWPFTKVLNGTTGSRLAAVPCPNTTDSAELSGNIAHGSADGFVKLANLAAGLNDGQVPPVSGDLTVVGALNKLLQGDNCAGTPVVVAGHSLGACQTQVMATYLGWQLGALATPSAVIGQAFAPPTPGDADLMASYIKMAPSSMFWANSLDLVPYAYVDLQWAASNLWTSFKWPASSVDPNNKSNAGESGPPLPALLAGPIETIGRLVPAVYTRPTSGVTELTGFMPQSQQIGAWLASTSSTLADDGSDAMLEWQHFPPCYSMLLWGQCASEMVGFAGFPYSFPS